MGKSQHLAWNIIPLSPANKRGPGKREPSGRSQPLGLTRTTQARSKSTLMTQYGSRTSAFFLSPARYTTPPTQIQRTRGKFTAIGRSAPAHPANSPSVARSSLPTMSDTSYISGRDTAVSELYPNQGFEGRKKEIIADHTSFRSRSPLRWLIQCDSIADDDSESQEGVD